VRVFSKRFVLAPVRGIARITYVRRPTEVFFFFVFFSIYFSDLRSNLSVFFQKRVKLEKDKHSETLGNPISTLS